MQLGQSQKRKRKRTKRLCFGRLRSSLCSLSSRQRAARQRGKLLHNQYVLWESTVSSGDTAQPVCCCTCTAVRMKRKMNRPSSLSLPDLIFFLCAWVVREGVCFHFSTFYIYLVDTAIVYRQRSLNPGISVFS